MKDSLFLIFEALIRQDHFVRQVQTLYIDLETSQYPWDGSFGLGNANDRSQENGGNDPEIQSREGNAMGFHIYKDGVTGSARSSHGCCSENSDSDCSNEES